MPLSTQTPKNNKTPKPAINRISKTHPHGIRRDYESNASQDETERTTRSHEFHCDQNGGGVEFIPQIIF